MKFEFEIGKKTFFELEKEVLVYALEQHDGHRVKTSDALGIGLRTLQKRLRFHGMTHYMQTIGRKRQDAEKNCQ